MRRSLQTLWTSIFVANAPATMRHDPQSPLRPSSRANVPTQAQELIEAGQVWTVDSQGRPMTPGQDNVYVPVPWCVLHMTCSVFSLTHQCIAIGLDALLCKPRIVTDRMIEGAAYALADSLDQPEREPEFVYPRLTRIREISAQIALAVMRTDVNSSAYRTVKVVVIELFLYRGLTKQVCFAKFPVLNY